MATHSTKVDDAGKAEHAVLSPVKLNTSKTVFDMTDDDFLSACRAAVKERDVVAMLAYVTRLDAETGKLMKVYQDGRNISSPARGHRPRILVFAGPKGSGKSTVTQKIPIIGLYVNADDIKRVSGCPDLDAAQEAESIRNMLLAAQKEFTFETVLSTARNLDLLRRAKENGYQIFAVYVLAKDSAINVRRVQRRAAADGRDVPVEIIRSRHECSLKNVAALVRIADKTKIVDNTGAVPDVICEIVGRNVRIYETEHWTKKEILALLGE